MGARCQGGCGEKENRRTRRTMTVCCRNREVPETGTLRGVGGEAFLPYPINTRRASAIALASLISWPRAAPTLLAWKGRGVLE